MKAVVFGGAGFLGSHVADALSEAGHEVTIYDLLESPYSRPGQVSIVGDIMNQEKVETVLEGAEFVYNLAGIADLDHAVAQPKETIRSNILGNAIVLDACIKQNIRRYVYASTIYVYSEKGGFYRCSKQACETYIEEFHRKFGLEFTILRYGTLYGSRANDRNSIYRYLKQALIEKKIVVSATGEERREYIHVRDAAQMSVKILDSKYANMHLTLTGHQSIYFKDLLNTVREILGNQLEIVWHKGLGANGNHYEMTPYTYSPKAGHKLTSNVYTDLGQGLIEVLAEIDRELSNGRSNAFDV